MAGGVEAGVGGLGLLGGAELFAVMGVRVLIVWWRVKDMSRLAFH